MPIPPLTSGIIARMLFLAALTFAAVFPLGPMQSKGYPVLPKLVTIACAFVVGQLFLRSLDHAASVGAYVVAVALTGVSWAGYLRARRPRVV